MISIPAPCSVFAINPMVNRLKLYGSSSMLSSDAIPIICRLNRHGREHHDHVRNGRDHHMRRWSRTRSPRSKTPLPSMGDSTAVEIVTPSMLATTWSNTPGMLATTYVNLPARAQHASGPLDAYDQQTRDAPALNAKHADVNLVAYSVKASDDLAAYTQQACNNPAKNTPCSEWDLDQTEIMLPPPITDRCV